MTVKCFLDTNIFIYCRDTHNESKRKKALALVKDLWSSGDGVISYQVITELAAVLSKKFSVADQIVAREVTRLMTWDPIPINEQVITEGLRIRQHYGLSFWDSWIVGAAVHAHCELIYSEDLQDGANYHGAVIRNPFV